MPHQFNIHPDFQNLRGYALPFNRLLLSLMNTALHVAGVIKSRPFGQMIKREKIIGLDGHRIPVLIIKPEHLTAPSPALLYFHGGAFILKHSPQHIRNAVSYACEANCCVIFVDFRLAPHHRFPAGFNDCYASLVWALQNAKRLGIDKQHIAVGGDSVGGALAASVAQKAVHDDGIELCGQLLIYPVTDAECKSQSSALYTDVPPLKQFSTRAIWEAYLGHSFTNETPAYASPIHGKLSGLPQTYVESTEFDALHDESVAYAHALSAHGVDVVLNETKRTVHGYDLVAPASELSREAITSRVHFLRKIFGA
jgi:acetyl esterase